MSRSFNIFCSFPGREGKLFEQRLSPPSPPSAAPMDIYQTPPLCLDPHNSPHIPQHVLSWTDFWMVPRRHIFLLSTLIGKMDLDFKSQSISEFVQNEKGWRLILLEEERLNQTEADFSKVWSEPTELGKGWNETNWNDRKTGERWLATTNYRV